MKRTHAVILVVVLCAWLGMFVLQIRLQSRQQEQYQTLVQTQHDTWQRQMQIHQQLQQSQPGLFLPMPMPPVVQPPPPPFPWFPLFYPALLAPLSLVAVNEQRRVQQQLEEEEQKTLYSEEDLMQNWEFKIIRSAAYLFDQPAFLQRILLEESVAGWQVVEKFDGMRVRLKRLAGSPGSDLPPGFDPYRIWVGPNFAWYKLLWGFSVLCLLLVVLFVLLQVFDPISPAVFGALVAAAGVGALGLGVLAIRQAAKYRKQLGS